MPHEVGLENRPEDLPEGVIQSRPWIGAAVILVVTMLAYLPAIRGGFIWDDDDYVTENETLHSLAGLRDIWLDPSATPQYYPLVHSSFWIENHLWGLNPTGYHIVNVLIHIANALLLWRLLTWLGVPVSWLIAFLFAVHPVHVESVAWITERKNVLSGLFYLGSTFCFLKYWDFTAKQTSSQTDNEAAAETDESPRNRGWYLAALLCFIGALLSKTVASTFPAALLVMIWWKRGRISIGNAITLLPFFVLGISLGLLTVWLEKNQVGASGIDWELSFLERCLIAGRALWFYAGKLVCPIPLVFTYPRWDIDTSQIGQLLFPIAAIAVMVGLALACKRVGRGPLAAVLFFAGTLFPALGFFDVYPMRFSFVADHFQYLASIGVIALVVTTLHAWLGRITHAESNFASWVGVFAVGILAVLTWQQGKIYHDIETLWRDTLAKNPASFMAHNNLGAILNERGDFVEAESHLREAVRLKPTFPDSVVNLAKAREGQGAFDEALSLYREATELSPGLAAAWNGLGATHGMKGQVDLAETFVSKALELDPGYAQAHSNLAAIKASQGDFENAATGFRAAVSLDPELVEARENLARVLMSLGKTKESETVWKEVLDQNPRGISAMLNLGVIAAGDGRLQTAVGYFEGVLAIDRNHAKATYNAGAMYDQLGETAKAKGLFERFEQLQKRGE